MNYNLDVAGVGSNYPFQDKMLKPRLPRSGFNWSHENIFTLENAGKLQPVFFDENLPSSDYSFSANVLMRVLPQVVPLYSRQYLYVHGFYIPYSSIWNMAGVYFTKGYSGKRVVKKPTIKDYLDANPTLATKWNNYTTVQGDLFTLLGIPSGLQVSSFAPYFTILPFVAYALVYKHYFLNKNLYIEDRRWLPDDDADFRIGPNGNLISNKYGDEPIDLFEFQWRDYQQDYFTSALPFQQRGNTPSLTVNAGDATLNFTLPIGVRADSDPDNPSPFELTSFSGQSISSLALHAQSGSDALFTLGVNPGTTGAYSMNIPTSLGNITGRQVTTANELIEYGVTANNLPLVLNNVGFTLDQFRNLAVAQSELERMARTDGSYFEFGLTFFGEAAKYAQDYRPVYFGGSFQQLVFSEVVQNSASTTSSPLGTYAGHGIVSSNGSLGSVHCDEAGYLLCMMSVMPDVYYCQGVDKFWTRLTQEEEFLPGRDKLGLTPVYNKEIYFTGNPDQDNDLFAYQNPFDEFRYKKNRISGKIADKTNLSFFPYTQARVFDTLPTYSKEFFKADNVRKDYLAAPTEDAYTGRCGFQIRAVEPLSFTGEPSPII